MRTLGLAAVMLSVAAAPAVHAASAPEALNPELPKSARGNGCRSISRDTKPEFDRQALKRRRKLARQSQRRNRGRA